MSDPSRHKSVDYPCQFIVAEFFSFVSVLIKLNYNLVEIQALILK
jgi:hypothetical protein